MVLDKNRIDLMLRTEHIQLGSQVQELWRSEHLGQQNRP